MPTQRLMPMPENNIDISNAIYKAAHNIREGQESQTRQKLADAQINKLEAENSPENQNYLKQTRDAELSKKQNDAKKAGLDIYTQRLSVIRDVDDFSKGLPYLAKDLEAFGEEGSRELMPRITYKTDLSGQKQIPDNDAFLKEKARIVDALSKMDSPKVGDKITWTEDVKDEATGKMETKDYTLLYANGAWTRHEATHGGIKDEKADRPYKVGQIINKKGAGGSEFQGSVTGFNEDGTAKVDKWTNVTKPDKDDKPEMTEPQAREKEFQLTKWESQLETTGGADPMMLVLMGMNARSMAKSEGKSDAEARAEEQRVIEEMKKGGNSPEAKAFIKDQRDYLRSFRKSGKATATKSSGSGATHTYVPGKGLVLKDSKGQK